MHEASLVEGILKLAIGAVNDYNAANPQKPVTRVRDIVCRYGLLACFEPETLRACLELFAEGTPAEGVELKLEAAPLHCRCDNCGNEFTLRERHFECPECHSAEVSFTGGHGLVVQAINVDAGEDKK